MRPGLRDAVERLYAEFSSRHPLPQSPDLCPCCVPDAEWARVASRPLRALTPDDLSAVLWEAPVADHRAPEHWLHVLPRMLEHMATERDDRTGSDWNVLAGRLAYYGWRSWPRTEATAIEAYLDALWADRLGRFPIPCEPDWDEIGSWLCVVAGAEDPTRYLGVWDADDSVSAIRHLAAFVRGEGARLRGGEGDPFWESPGADVVRAWIARPAIFERLSRAAEDHPEHREELEAGCGAWSEHR